MFKRNYFFFHHCLLSCRCLMLQNQYFSLTKMGAQAATRGVRPLIPPSPVATALVGSIHLVLVVKFKFIDFEKAKFKFIDFAKVKFKFINNS